MALPGRHFCRTWLGTSNATFATVALGNLVGLTGTIVLPVFVDGWTEGAGGLGLSPVAAGAVAGAEGLALAIGVIAATAVPRWRPSGRAAGGVAALAAIAFSISAFAPNALALILPRMTAAALGGLVFAECARGLAGFAHPARGAATITFLVALAGAATVYGLEALRPVIGLAGVTLTYAAYLMSLAVALGVASGAEPASEAVDGGVIDGRGLLVLAAIAGCVVADQGVYAFAHLFAARAGVAHDDFAPILGLSSAIAPIGALLALTRLATVPSMAATGALLVKAIAVLALVQVSHAPALLTAMTMSSIALYLATPSMMGIAASLDRSGRLVALAGATILLSTAAGPFAAGVVLDAARDARGTADLATIGACLCAVAAACIVLATRPVSKRELMTEEAQT